VAASGDVRDAVEEHREWIAGEVLAVSLDLVDALDQGAPLDLGDAHARITRVG
jgi:hypothetical protein